LLAQYLLELKRNFGEFDLTLERTIRTVRAEGSRNRKQDRELVLSALETGCAEIDEIAEETELPEPDVQKILNLFLRAGLVEIVPRGAANELVRGAKRDYYSLTAKACEKYGLKNPLT
jgi:DNA-binding MarR family transcriptional regulator